MLQGLHLTLEEVREPFEPEGGAYGRGALMGHSHGNTHGEAHGNHHTHGPGCNHGHEH
jgi:urease accessory protein